MIPSAKVISFAATSKPAEARKFYSDTLGLKLIGEDSFALVFDLNGTMLRVQKVQDLKPAPHTILGWSVSNIGLEVAELRGKGIIFERYPGPRAERGEHLDVAFRSKNLLV